ncbi:uncharacterized protein [Rhodnius prolixus]|uniref:Uncharacterized protein n=1 Tax=Rhodnius prolixus TaxID=13249 RepID=T1HR17_RHOPR
MNQLILLCLIGAAWAMHTGNTNVVPSDVTQEQYNQSVDRPVHTREYPGVQPSTASFPPGYKPVYDLVLSRSVPTFGSGYKVAGTSGPFYPYVVTSVPVAGVADTGSYPYFPFPPGPYQAATRSYPYFPFPIPTRTNQAATSAAADCPFWPLC